MDIARETMAYTRNNILIQVAQAMFTVDDLWTMDVVYADYTFIDNSPSVVIDHVAGVWLADVMDTAEIDPNFIEIFFFWTRDKQRDHYTSYFKISLTGTDDADYSYYLSSEKHIQIIIIWKQA